MKLRLRMTLGVILLLFASACSGEPLIDSREIALTMNDFPNEMSLVSLEPITNKFDIWTYELGRDKKVRRDFDNGTYTWYSKRFSLVDRGGNIIYRTDCGDDPFAEQTCQYYVSAESHVLSFKTVEGARRAFQVLAEPQRGGFFDEKYAATGEKETYPSHIGDESRVFEHAIENSMGLKSSTEVRVIARRGRIVVLVRGTEERETRWGPGPIDARYYAILTSRMVDRVDQRVLAKR